MQTLAVDVREVDVLDDRQLRRWNELSEAAYRFERPWAPHLSFEELAAQVRAGDDDVAIVVAGAFDGGDMVGGALLRLPLLDNVEKVYGEIFVEPRMRNRGIGGALLRHITDVMRDLGRNTLLVDTGIPASRREDHPYTLFARRHGFTMASVEVHRVLDLPVDPSVIAAMQARAAPHHVGYRLLTFEDMVPDDLIDSYVHLLNQLAVDAPTGEVEFEPEGLTPEHWRRHQQRLLDAGRHKLVTIAVDDSGEAVAHSDLVVPREDRPKVYQWGTLVRRDHRGHHLGAAAKLQNLVALQERYPERTEIHTTNAEDNAPMVGINERLGFRPVEICPGFQLRL